MCISRCGDGPNVDIRPSGQQFSRVDSPHACAKLLFEAAGGDAAVVAQIAARVDALAQRRSGEAAAAAGDYENAERLLSAALSAGQPESAPAALTARAAVRLAAGRLREAAEDAQLAARGARGGAARARAHLVAATALGALGEAATAEAECDAAVKADSAASRGREWRAARDAINGVAQRTASFL